MQMLEKAVRDSVYGKGARVMDYSEAAISQQVGTYSWRFGGETRGNPIQTWIGNK